MTSHYNRLKIKKIIQAVGYLLSLNDSKMNFTKLLKLLYLADREALNNWDSTITGDSYAAMKNGPILSLTYDLINNRGSDFEQCEWDVNFNKENYDLILKSSIVYDELSTAELTLLKDVDLKFKNFNYSKMIDYIHDNNKLFPEYKNPGDSSTPIRLKDILKALGRSDKDIKSILSEEDLYKKEKEFLINNCY